MCFEKRAYCTRAVYVIKCLPISGRAHALPHMSLRNKAVYGKNFCMMLSMNLIFEIVHSIPFQPFLGFDLGTACADVLLLY